MLSPFVGDPRECRGDVAFPPSFGPQPSGAIEETGTMGAPQAQCTRSATIWASGRTRDPYFEILGAPRGIMVTPSGGFDF